MSPRQPGLLQLSASSLRCRVGLGCVDVLHAWDVQQRPRPLPTRCPGGPPSRTTQAWCPLC